MRSSVKMAKRSRARVSAQSSTDDRAKRSIEADREEKKNGLRHSRARSAKDARLQKIQRLPAQGEFCANGRNTIYFTQAGVVMVR